MINIVEGSFTEEVTGEEKEIFEGSFNEEGTGAGKAAIFEGGFKFAASEARKKFNRTASVDRGVIGDQLGRNRGVIVERAIEKLLVIYEK